MRLVKTQLVSALNVCIKVFENLRLTQNEQQEKKNYMVCCCANNYYPHTAESKI